MEYRIYLKSEMLEKMSLSTFSPGGIVLDADFPIITDQHQSAASFDSFIIRFVFTDFGHTLYMKSNRCHSLVARFQAMNIDKGSPWVSHSSI